MLLSVRGMQKLPFWAPEALAEVGKSGEYRQKPRF